MRVLPHRALFDGTGEGAGAGETASASGPIMNVDVQGPAASRSQWFATGDELFISDDLFSTLDGLAPEPTGAELAGGDWGEFNYDLWIKHHELLFLRAGTTCRVMSADSQGACVRWDVAPSPMHSDEEPDPRYFHSRQCYKAWSMWNPDKVRVVQRHGGGVGGVGEGAPAGTSNALAQPLATPVQAVPCSPESTDAASALLQLGAPVEDGQDIPEQMYQLDAVCTPVNAVEIGGASPQKPCKSRPYIPVVPASSPKKFTGRLSYIFTERPAAELLQPPAFGTVWTWNPEVVGADGNDAAPNGIDAVCKEDNATYDFVRGHCSVHLQRTWQQRKHDLFPGNSKADASTLAENMSSWMEQVKCHSATVATAQHGKLMLQSMLESMPNDKGKTAAAHFGKEQLNIKWTLAEMNESTAAGGGVPCHANGIERKNYDQKDLAHYKRHNISTFLQHQKESLQLSSAEDLEFGRKMPRGYSKSKTAADAGVSRGVSRDKEVWTMKFFAAVKEEMDNCIGIQNLTWTVKNFAPYPKGTLIMCSGRMRSWLLRDEAFKKYFDSFATSKDKVKCLRAAVKDKSVQENGEDDDAYLTQFRNLIADPKTFVEDRSLTFQEFIAWQRHFHILQPILDDTYVRCLVARLRASQLPLVDAEVEKLFSGEQRFYKCTCSEYKHYAWCLHMAVRACADGLVAAPFCPPTLNPEKIQPVKRKFIVEETRPQVGRPRNAVPGGALGNAGGRPAGSAGGKGKRR